MNPKCKACYAPPGPNCRYRTGPLRSLFVGTDCTKYPGMALGGGVTDCSYYKPVTFWDDFWSGVSTASIIVLTATCIVVLWLLAVEIIKS